MITVYSTIVSTAQASCTSPTHIQSTNLSTRSPSQENSDDYSFGELHASRSDHPQHRNHCHIHGTCQLLRRQRSDKHSVQHNHFNGSGKLRIEDLHTDHLGNEDRDAIRAYSISHAVDRDRNRDKDRCGKSDFGRGGMGQFGWLSSCATGVWSDERIGVVNLRWMVKHKGKILGTCRYKSQ